MNLNLNLSSRAFNSKWPLQIWLQLIMNGIILTRMPINWWLLFISKTQQPHINTKRFFLLWRFMRQRVQVLWKFARNNLAVHWNCFIPHCTLENNCRSNLKRLIVDSKFVWRKLFVQPSSFLFNNFLLFKVLISYCIYCNLVLLFNYIAFGCNFQFVELTLLHVF